MKYVHILFVILFFGLFVANYYYLSINLKPSQQRKAATLTYALRFSFYVDVLLAIGIVIIPVTCFLLIEMLNFSHALPWLVSAYWLCSIVTIAWLAILLLKVYYFRDPQPRYLAWFHLFNIIVIISLLLTLHDAVFQQTLLGPVRAISDTLALFNWIKILHIVSACILFGTGLGTAFYLFLANIKKDIALIANASNQVLMGNLLFTMPAGVLQLITGLGLVMIHHYSFTQLWVIGSIIGYVIAGACWLPVVYLQIQCRDLAMSAKENNQPLPQSYYRFYRWWCVLGVPAFLALFVVIYFMTDMPTW